MHSENKTLIILTPGFPASVADSTCLPMQQSFVKALKQNYPSLDIIILSFQYPYITQTYSWFGITVMSFNGQNKGGLSRLMLRRKLNAVLKQLNSSHKIAGILSFWYNECAWVGNKFASRNNLKHFCWILGQDARPANKYPKSLQLPAGELIALSDFLQDEFGKNHGIKPGHVIPPGMDAAQFKTISKQKDIDLLAAGSCIPLKQFEIFIETVAEIKSKIPGIKAALVGDGPEMSAIKKLVKRYQLQSTITLTGELPYPEVLQWMQRARIFLHPSSYEGFSGVCQEALAAGAHVISFCRPMKQDISNWHIVSDKEQMNNLALEIVQKRDHAYPGMIPFCIDDTVNNMVQLFEM
ncbi:MAG: glycosyltransferase family 4 protein [Ferruginibacter sp.]